MNHRERLVYIITAPMSAKHLLKGQLSHMREQGWDVHLVCGRGEAAREAAQREGVTLHEVSLEREISLSSDFSALLDLVRILRQLRPQVVSVSTPKAGLLGGLAAWLCRVPRRVYVVRGLRYQGASGLRRALLWGMETASSLMASHVVAISPSLAQRRTLDHLPRAAIVIGSGSSNGVDVPALTTDARARGVPWQIRDLRAAFPGVQVVLFVGRLTADKGILELAAAIAQGGGRHHLVTVGPQEGPLPPQLSALSDEGLWTSIGYEPEVGPWMAAADVLVLPSYREGFGNVVLEAAAVRTPSVVSDVDGARDTIRPDETGLLVPVRDAAALLQALDRLRADPGWRGDLGARAHRRAVEEFQPARIWAGLERLYNSPEVSRPPGPNAAPGSATA